MFDLIGPIGAIQSKNGKLEFGNVGTTNCVYFSYRGDADFVPTVIYTSDELEDLIGLVELAAKEIKTLTKGSIVRLGCMTAKPITLRLALVHPHQGEAFLLLRLLQGNWSQDITCLPQALLQLLKSGQVDGPKPLCGPLERDSDGAWTIGGEKLEILQGLSPGRGYFGEYIHPDEVSEGEVLEVWPFTVEEKKLVATFRYKRRTSSTGDGPGAKADCYLARGQNHLARKEILKLAKQQLDGGKVLAPWAAKASLTYLLSELADGNDQSAQAIWLGNSENKFLRMGVNCMEAGQTSSHDALIYHQISAYFHSLNPDVPRAVEGVNHLMKTVCEGCEEFAPQMLGMALCNWYLYLKEAFEKEPPTEALAEWNKAVRRSGLKPRPKVISFPSPDTWEVEEELTTTGSSPIKRSSPEKPKERNLQHLLAAFVVLLVVGLLVSKLFSIGESGTEQAFVGDPSLSISGISLDQTWDEIDASRTWEDRQATILSNQVDGGYLRIRFDADKKLRFIEGREIWQDGQPLFNSDSELDQVLARWGKPSKRGQSRRQELNYVYDDAGQKCVVTMVFMDGASLMDPRTGRMMRRGPMLHKARLTLAGDRWKDSPSLPILSR